VVLGGGIRERGTLRPTVELTDESHRRMLCGIELYQQHTASTLVMTGGDARIFGVGPKEAPIMKEWAVRLGVPSEAVLVNDQTRTTYEDAVGTKRVLGNATSIVLVTSAYHIPRAMALFKKQGFEVMPYACGFHSKNSLMDIGDELTIFDFVPSSGALQQMTDVIEETAGIVVYWLTGRL